MRANLLRSSRLSILLASAIATLAMISTLLPWKGAGPPGSVPPSGFLGAAARILGLVDTFRSPLFLFLVALLCLNMVACLVHRVAIGWGARLNASRFSRTRVRLALDAAVHLSILLVVAGGAAKGLWGFAGTQSVHVGLTTATAFEPSSGADIPLGFEVRVLRRQDAYHPLEALVGIRDGETGEKLALAELREGVANRVSGTDLLLEPVGLDRPAGVLALRVQESGRSARLEFSVRLESGAENRRFGGYLLTLVAYRHELKDVRALVAIEEGGRRVAEGWVSPRAKIVHRGLGCALIGWGSDPFGAEFVSLQFTRDRAAPLFWAGCLLFAAAAPAFFLVRARRPSA